MSGIYGILVDGALVYIGKAGDLEERKKQHWHEILKDGDKENKYRLLQTAVQQHCRIQFVVMEYVAYGLLLDVEEEYIKALRPCLNSKHNGDRGRHITAQEFFDEVWGSRLIFTKNFDII